MSVTTVRRVVCRMGPDSPATDAELVTAIAPIGGVDREAAFVELLGRYGPMVLGVCRRVLGDAHDAEDAFQAAFLVLARKAGTIRPPGAVGGWLYGVAVRTARKAKTAAARRRRREMATAGANRVCEPADSSVETADLRAVIDAELAALPDTQRAAVVLCDLQGKTRAEAAAELNRPEGTVAAWLARGRKALGARLARRGVALPAAGVVAVVTPAVVSAQSISAAVATFLGRGASIGVLALAEGVMKSLSSTSTKLAAVVVVVGSLLAAVATATAWPAGDANPPAPNARGAAAAAPEPPPAKPESAVAWKETKVLGLPGWISGSVAYSPDGKQLFVGGTNGNVKAYDTKSWKQLWEYDSKTNCPSVAVSPDGKSVAFTFKDADRRWGVRLLNAATGKLEHTLDEGGVPGVVGGPEPYSVGFFPDVVLPDSGEPPLTSRKLIFGTAGGYVVKTWIDPEKASTITSRTVAVGKNPADYHAVPLAVDPNGKRVVVTGPIDKKAGKNVLWAWSAGSGEANKLLEGHKGTVVSTAWSKNGKVIVTGDDAGVVIVWDAATFKEKSRVTLGGRIVAVAVSPDGMGIAASAIRPSPTPLPGQAGCTGDVFVWLAAFPPKKPEPLSSTQTGSPFSGIASLAFAPDGKSLASTFANFTLLTRTGILVGQVQIFAVALPSMTTAPRTVYILVGQVRIFAVAPAEPEKPVPPVAVDQKWTDTSVLTDHGRLVNGVAVAPDGKSFVAATDGNVTCWETKTRKKLWDYKPTDSVAFALAYSPDGKHLCLATKTDVARLDAKTGKPDPWTRDKSIWFGKVGALAYHPDGERLAASNGYETRVRRLGGKGEEITIGAPPKESEPAPILPSGLAWSKDGKWLAVIQPQQEGKMSPVTLWEVDSKAKNTKLLTGHDDPVTAVAWAKDGKVIASGDEKGTVILWDVATGKELWRKKFTGRDETDGRINALAFSPTENTLAAALSLGSGKQPERVLLLAAKDGEAVGQVMRAWRIPVSSVAWAKDGNFFVTGCGAAGRAIAQTEPAVGEVVIWERKP